MHRTDINDTLQLEGVKSELETLKKEKKTVEKQNQKLKQNLGTILHPFSNTICVIFKHLLRNRVGQYD